MNSILVLTTILAVVCFCYVKETYSLKCYECHSCNDPFDSKEAQIKDCNGSCIIVKVSDDVDRHCYTNTSLDICSYVEHRGQKISTCFCKNDLCNGESVETLSNQHNGGSLEKLSVILGVTIFVVIVLKALFW